MKRVLNISLLLICVLCAYVLAHGRIKSSTLETYNDLKVYENAVKQKSSLEKNTLTYIRASIPTQIFRCMRKQTVVRCIKLFLLQRMEDSPIVPSTGNLTKDFLDQFVNNDRKFLSLNDKKYANISDSELTKKLIRNLRMFFKGRDIKLQFLPGVLVQVLPSNENKIKISLKKNKAQFRGHKSYKKMIQMAVPVMLMPAIILGSFLPFLIPAIKMGAIMSTLMNNGALLAAIIYAARTAAMSNEQPVQYSYPGYH